MKIKKIGHCCLVIDIHGLRILTDPGEFTAKLHSDLANIDIILITHEHGDHIHVDSLEEIVVNNPGAVVVTNTATAKLLDEKGMAYKVLEGRDSEVFNDVKFEAYDAKHEEIFEDFGQVQNTGYFIAEKLFYPGDAYCNPEKEVDILALPVAGPWCNIKDAVTYALQVSPRVAFPVHDGMLQEDKIGGSHKVPENILGANKIKFVPMKAGEEHDFS